MACAFFMVLTPPALRQFLDAAGQFDTEGRYPAGVVGGQQDGDAAIDI